MNTQSIHGKGRVTHNKSNKLSSLADSGHEITV
jgi:hypothetical protein